jgi:hypothetical protein
VNLELCRSARVSDLLNEEFESDKEEEDTYTKIEEITFEDDEDDVDVDVDVDVVKDSSYMDEE